MVALGLAGEADDERRAERGGGFVGADAIDDLQEAVAVAPALHRAQQRRRRVLQREVEVRDDRRQLEHRRHERIVHFRRVEVEQPDARQAVRARARSSRRSNGSSDPGSSASRPYHARSCATSTTSRHAVLDEVAHLGLDRFRSTRALLAAERRDRAERAGAVAAFGDLDVGPRRVGRGARQLEQVAHAGRRGSEAHRRVVRDRPSRPPPRSTTPPRTRRPRRARAAPSASSAPERSARHPVATSCAPSLRAAASARIVSIDSSRAASMKAQVFTTTRSASPGPSARHEPVGQQRADDLVGVDHVLRAPEGLDEEPARRSRAGSGGHRAIVPATAPLAPGRPRPAAPPGTNCDETGQEVLT